MVAQKHYRRGGARRCSRTVDGERCPVVTLVGSYSTMEMIGGRGPKKIDEKLSESDAHRGGAVAAVSRPRYGKGGSASVAGGGWGVEGRMEATLAQVLVEENTRGWKGDGSDRVPHFIEVGAVGNKGPGGSAGGHVEARAGGQAARLDLGSGGRGRVTAASCD
jgi:hypothetical protein